MRNNKNNITSGLENIIPFSRNITSHFTGKEKIITLASTIIILSFINITFTSALSYQSNVGIGFTFNPGISVSISPSNLVIDNLTPSITADSNAITVSVATNAAYGYTLSAMVNNNGNSGNGSNNNNSNSNLTHTNGTSVFSSIATDASLSSLTNDNTWGYSYRLSNNSNSNAWSNYSGLSNETSKTLVDSNDQTAIPIDFKIATKASETQPSGVYTGTINFIAIAKPTPMNLAESYFAAGKTRHNGYYAMQDMTSEICNNTEVIGEGSQIELIDLRDNKVYWATKLADGHCWMTQNLDLDLDSSRTYTHWDTDLGWTVLDNDAEWRPERSTINFSGNSVPGWKASQTYPYSANPGDIYYYTSKTNDSDILYSSLQDCTNAGHDDCTHYHAGNYYNWPATITSNNTSDFSSGDALNSICPSGWKIMNAGDDEVGEMLYLQGVISSPTSMVYSAQGFNLIRSAPLYFVRSGNIDYSITGLSTGWYWYNNVKKEDIYFYARYFQFSSNKPILNDYYGTQRGFSVRCLAR